ncbi:MAG: GAF domain-containing sensor histidine kinase [Candidatus Jacksonbacteria bacterium]
MINIAEVNQQLKLALAEQQRVSMMVIQKDLELSEINDRLNRQVNQLKMLQDVVNQVRLIDDKKRVLDVIARGLVLDLHFSAAVILLGTPPFNMGVNYSYKNIESKKIQSHLLLQRIYYTGKAVKINIDKADLNHKRLANILYLTSFYILPLQIRTKRYGLFICGLDDPYQKLTEADVEFLEIAANSISITLESLEIEERQKAVDVMKSEFISIASHQLRTPLSVIKWTLKMCLDGDLGRLTQEQSNFLTKTYDSNERMINLINDLLDVSRIEEGKLEYQFTKFDIKQLIKEVLDQYKVFIKEKRLLVKTNIGDQGKILTRGDREKLFLVFSNLIDNAVKFTPKGGMIDILVNKDKNRAQVTIKDSGIGIGAKDQEQLFTKFFRAESAKRVQTQGSGLGLFIVKNIIKKHKGKIKIDSILNKGTTVACWLP